MSRSGRLYWLEVFALTADLQSGLQPSDFVTIALLVALEGLLSADNAMVLAVLVLGLPDRAAEGAPLRHRRRLCVPHRWRRCSRST